MIKLELTLEEINKILAGLGEMPAKASIELIMKIRAEASSQLSENEQGPE